MPNFWKNMWFFGGLGISICGIILLGWRLAFGHFPVTDYSFYTVPLDWGEVIISHVPNILGTFILAIMFAFFYTKIQKEYKYKDNVIFVFASTLTISFGGALFLSSKVFLSNGALQGVFALGIISLVFGIIISIVSATFPLGSVSNDKYVSYFNIYGLLHSWLVMLLLGWPAGLISLACFSLIAIPWWTITWIRNR